MKKWNVEQALKLPLAGLTDLPRPFPGRFPTRMVWSVQNEDGRKWTYLGKPSVNAASEYLKYARLTGTVRATIVEFDRQYRVASGYAGAPTTRVRNNAASRLWEYYHPFWLAQMVPGANRQKFYSNKVAGHWIYSSSPQLTIAEINSHTTWLRGRGF